MPTFLHLRNRHFFVLDLCILVLVAYFSCVLRLDRFNLTPYWSAFYWVAGLALLVYPLVYRVAGLYSRYWRYASVGDLLLLLGATLTAGLLHSGLLLGVGPLLLPASAVPRSIPLIFFLLMLTGTAVPRLLARAWLWQQQRFQGGVREPVLIYGAGSAGILIAQELARNPHLGQEVVGFVDDDPGKHHLRIQGVPVLGGGGRSCPN